MKFSEKLPAPVRSCCGRLRRAGFEAYPVGGCVRDLLLGRAPGDWDIASSALPQTVLSLFPHTVPTGLKHGTVTVLLDGMSLEVTAFRGESGYSDGRHPDAVTFGVGLREDLARRDFSINAMALDRDGSVLDPFGGRADLDARLIRAVGRARQRFEEDALRMLRAIRFSAQLGFTIEAGTAAALAVCAPLMDRVSAERVRAELEKILLSPEPERAALPVELGMLVRFGAEAGRVELSCLRDTPPDQVARWRSFCAATGLDITRLPVERSLRRAVLHPERDVLDALAVTGRELYNLGLRGGEIGAARQRMLEHVLAHPGNNRRAVLLALLGLDKAGPIC